MEKLCVGKESDGIEAVLLHGGEHGRKLVEARDDEHAKVSPRAGPIGSCLKESEAECQFPFGSVRVTRGLLAPVELATSVFYIQHY